MDLLIGLLTVTSWVFAVVIGITLISDFVTYMFYVTTIKRNRYRPFAGWVYISMLISVIFLVTKAIYYVPGSLSC